MSEGLLPPASASWKKHPQRNSRGSISFGVQKPSSASAIKTVLRTYSVGLVVDPGHCPAPQAAADRQTDERTDTGSLPSQPTALRLLCCSSSHLFLTLSCHNPGHFPHLYIPSPALNSSACLHRAGSEGRTPGGY